MTIEELKASVESYRSSLREKNGVMCRFSESGPVGMSVIDDIISVLTAQQQRIEELEQRNRTG